MPSGTASIALHDAKFEPVDESLFYLSLVFVSSDDRRNVQFAFPPVASNRSPLISAQWYHAMMMLCESRKGDVTTMTAVIVTVIVSVVVVVLTDCS